MILLVINRVSNSGRFNGYSYLDEMKSLAIQHILLYTHKFDEFRQSPITNQYVSSFAYISTIVHNAFIATINTHKKEEEKAKEDFVETQKLFHKDANKSTYESDFSCVKESVHINNISISLLDEIKKIPITTEDIEIIYPFDYKISIEEFHNITYYTKLNKMTTSIVRNEK